MMRWILPFLFIFLKNSLSLLIGKIYCIALILSLHSCNIASAEF